ncbi:2-dehydro-3-deoxy-phosphogluconate aldolase [Fusibacter ferrireducens]|uniref:Oxo-acid lyase n=1 Tax=Fusibacter ferrireducens TaxID=2785058 RepID=A0ABR9ZW98_9FIRM|nr:KDGP aldolase [Fusibacter ferrireducens]MBF4694727.1 oxo-acid lyase [Fusibacter ferrireducens]
MNTNIRFYKDRVAINCLAKNVENGSMVWEASEGYSAIGVLSNQFETVEEGISYVEAFRKKVPCVSVGLGDGDPSQGFKAAMIAGSTNPGHVNQVFTSAGFAAGYLKAKGAENTAINALISPTGQVGMVKINTGLLSSKEPDAVVTVETAIAMLKDMGAHSVKFFPMGGEKSLEELKYVAKVCAEQEMPMIEPTGGINLANFETILKVCLDAGVKKIMPHVYGAIIDKETGNTDPEKVKLLLEKVKKLV